MKQRLLALTLVAAASHSLAAGGAAPLRIKGVQIGDSEETACSGAKTSSPLEDHTKSLQGSGIEFNLFDAKECHPDISRTAGILPSEPPHILLLNGKVAFFKFTLQSVPLDKQADILQALKAEYGRWHVTHKNGLSMFTWKRRNTSLQVERQTVNAEGDDLHFYLRDTTKMKAYLAEIDRVSEILKKQVSEDRAKSVLQKD